MEFIFLLCSERSGSNFITNFLGGHSQISGPPPSHLFRLTATNLDRYGGLQSEELLKIFAEDVVNGHKTMLGNWYTGISQEELFSLQSSNPPADFLRYIYEKEAEFEGASHVLVKENQLHLFVPFILTNFPSSKFLMFVRDPRDVASSWLETDSIPDGIKRAIDTWNSDQENNLQLFHQLKFSNRVLVSRYEDILDNTESELSRILDWLGLDFEEDMYNFGSSIRTSENAKKVDAWKNLEAGILKNNHSKFRDSLSDVEIRYIEARAEELMDQLGYQLIFDFDEIDKAMLIGELEPQIRSGGYALSPDEKLFRDRRLEHLQHVLKRKKQVVVGR